MKTERRRLGDWGEGLVLKYYLQNGFALLGRNVRVKRSELDLLFEKDRVLYSVEVKTRRSLYFGDPEESIDAQKRARLFRATAQYAGKHKKIFHAIVVQICALTVSKDTVMLKIYTLEQ